MAKIAYIGKFKGSSTGTEISVSNAFMNLGHAVTEIDYNDDKAVAHICDTSAKYDLALFSKCEPVTAETIKQFKCKTAMWIFDSIHTTTLRKPRRGAIAWTLKAVEVDKFFTAAPGDIDEYDKMGCKATFLPQGCDDTVFFDQVLKRDIEISFVGNMYGKMRKPIINRLHERYGNRFKLYSHSTNWGVPTEGAVNNDGAANVYNRSIVTLNLSELPRDDKWSRRVWDAMGCGAIVLAQHCPSFGKFFTNEMAWWKTEEELYDLIEWWTSNNVKARKISKCAAELVREKHTYRNRAKQLLNEMEGV